MRSRPPLPVLLPALAAVLAIGAVTLSGTGADGGAGTEQVRPVAAVGGPVSASVDPPAPGDALSIAGPVEADRPGLPEGSTVLAAGSGGPASPSAAARAAPPRKRAAPGLGPDETAFWDGAFVADGAVRTDALCGVAGPCFEYPLRLRTGGARLRVAIDTPSREDTFRVDVVDPSGSVVASTSNGGQFNAEAFLASPAPGAYLVRVVPVAVEDAAFRMRAKLESTVPQSPAGRVAVLPNLQVVPPYEFGFAAPVTPNGSYPPDAANPPASAGGQDLYSCTQDEAAPVEAGGAGAIDCLRLTSGPMNVGPGPFDMRFTFVDDLLDGTADPVYLRGPILQAVHFSDGSEEHRAAGTYIFHTTHAHFHDENILTYEGFRVVDRKRGRLQRFGEGTKSGFCPADQLFADWFRFDQAVRGDFGEGDSPTGNCFDAKDGLLGLTSGWGDVYRWQRPGQYVEFAGQGDGLYVIRSTVDAANAILETDETDNTSYALIRIVGRSVDIIERGQGTDPWDPRKLVFEGDGPASVR